MRVSLPWIILFRVILFFLLLSTAHIYIFFSELKYVRLSYIGISVFLLKQKSQFGALPEFKMLATK